MKLPIVIKAPQKPADTLWQPRRWAACSERVAATHSTGPRGRLVRGPRDGDRRGGLHAGAAAAAARRGAGWPGFGDEAVRRVLGRRSPAAVVWLASRAISYMDESGLPRGRRSRFQDARSTHRRLIRSS